MSQIAMSHVLKLTCVPVRADATNPQTLLPSEKLVLVLLANYMSQDTLGCKVPVRHLAKLALLSEAQLRRILSRLIGLGVLIATRQAHEDGGAAPTLYRFWFDTEPGEKEPIMFRSRTEDEVRRA